MLNITCRQTSNLTNLKVLLYQKKNILLSLLLLKAFIFLQAQNNKINMNIQFFPDEKKLNVKQNLTYYNHSQDTLHEIYFHDWNHAFSHKNTALGKRFVENYSKKFFFAPEKERGFTKIFNVNKQTKALKWKRINADDIIKVILDKPLLPEESIQIDLFYTLKIPDAKFTSYGVDKNVFNLRYWYLTPAIYDGHWQLMHHLDMDDLYEAPTDFELYFEIPENFTIASNLNITESAIGKYRLKAKNTKDIQVFLSPEETFIHFKTDFTEVVTNLNNIELSKEVKKDLLSRQLDYLEKHLGPFKHDILWVNKTSYEKNPLYGMNQLPSFLRPFSDSFEWDMRMFKTLTGNYLDQSLLYHTRKDRWLRDAIQTYLMIQYIDTYYPEVNLMGNLSKIWGLRTYQMAKHHFNERYQIVYQYTTRSNNDQSLLTPSDSLTNFNRLIFSKFKGGLSLRYLDQYLKDSTVSRGIKKYFQSSANYSSDFFVDFINKNTSKDVHWFYDELIASDKNINYKLKKIKKIKDSIRLRLFDQYDSKIPVQLTQFDKNSKVKRQYIEPTASKTKLQLPIEGTKKWVINQELTLPESNFRDNTIKTNGSLFNKSIKIKLLRDLESPQHHQLFLEPKIDYNFYDGLILATSIKNKTFIPKNFEYSLKPAYGIKSTSLNGSFKFTYHKYLDSEIINSYRLGIVGSHYHYKPGLSYAKFIPYAQIFFKRKNLRSVKNSVFSVNFTRVYKEISPEDLALDKDNFQVLNFEYHYQNPELINRFSFKSNLEFGSKYSKIFADMRWKKLANNNQLFGLRLFMGTFLYNKTDSDFFSFGINRPNDYTFSNNYYGRSEDSGIFSQQIIIGEGGFIAEMPVQFANKWFGTIQTNISLWRWVELYTDVGWVKNRQVPVQFIHDKGIRLNFVEDYLEIYFPIHSTNAWDISQKNYYEKIRFVFRADFNSLYSFVRRGFF